MTLLLCPPSLPLSHSLPPLPPTQLPLSLPPNLPPSLSPSHPSSPSSSLPPPLPPSHPPSLPLSVPPSSQAFYRLCLTRKNFTVIVSDNITEGNCTDYVCASQPFYLASNSFNYSGICEQCYQPYSFVCKFPLEVVWYIIYWLFFVLSW